MDSKHFEEKKVDHVKKDKKKRKHEKSKKKFENLFPTFEDEI